LEKLRTHGGKVMRDVGILVQYVKDDEGDLLIEKINKVNIEGFFNNYLLIYQLNFFLDC